MKHQRQKTKNIVHGVMVEIRTTPLLTIGLTLCTKYRILKIYIFVLQVEKEKFCRTWSKCELDLISYACAFVLSLFFFN